jgi:quercetin dioxygenase-like cupin family protein
MEHIVLSKGIFDERIQKTEAPGKHVQLLVGDWTEQYAVATIVLHDVLPEAEVHDHGADIFTCLSGEVTFTLGGEMVDKREAKPGEWKAASIVGGTQTRVRVGDVVSIPAGVPHQMDARGQRAVLMITKVRYPVVS